jgi:hypothetical protein
MSTPEQKCIGSPEPISERRSEAFAQANRAFSKAALTLKTHGEVSARGQDPAPAL